MCCVVCTGLRATGPFLATAFRIRMARGGGAARVFRGPGSDTPPPGWLVSRGFGRSRRMRRRHPACSSGADHSCPPPLTLEMGGMEGVGGWVGCLGVTRDVGAGDEPHGGPYHPQEHQRQGVHTRPTSHRWSAHDVESLFGAAGPDFVD